MLYKQAKTDRWKKKKKKKEKKTDIAASGTSYSQVKMFSIWSLRACPTAGERDIHQEGYLSTLIVPAELLRGHIYSMTDVSGPIGVTLSEYRSPKYVIPSLCRRQKQRELKHHAKNISLWRFNVVLGLSLFIIRSTPPPQKQANQAQVQAARGSRGSLLITEASF